MHPQTVEEPTEGPRRLHLDAEVPDIAAARDRIIELGGTHVTDREMGGFHWTVMADPEGNEFCIAGRTALVATRTAEWLRAMTD